MTERKTISHIGPERSCLFAGLFGKGLSGYNWQFHPQLNYLLRRPGTTPFAAPVDEFSVNGTAYIARSGVRSVRLRHGLSLLAEYVRSPLQSVLLSSSQPTQNFILDTTAGTLNRSAASRKQTDLFAVGTYPWLALYFRLGQFAVATTVTVSDVAGVKTVTFTRLAQTDALVAALSTGQAVLNIAGLLSGAQTSAGQAGLPLYALPYGATVYEAGDYFEIPAFVPVPGTETARIVPPIVVTGTATTTDIRAHNTPATSTQLGNSLYIAGNGAPLLRFDGSRLHVAGAMDANRVSQFVSAPTLGGTGITGTYKYAFLHRVYGADGNYTDGEVYVYPSTISPANQTVTLTVSSDSSRSLVFYGESYRWPQNDASGTARYFGPAFKSTNYSISGTGPYSCNVYGTAAPGHVFPGDPLFEWNGTTLNKLNAVKYIYPNGSFDTVSPISSTANQFCAGDVFVILRTLSGGTTYYELAEVPTGVTSFADSTADASLLLKPQYIDTAYLRSPPPAAVGAVVSHQTRLVTLSADNHPIGDTTTSRQAYTNVTWSEPNTEHFPFDNAISLEGLCRTGVALASVNDVLYVLTDNGVFYVHGALNSAQTFTFSKLLGSEACASAAGVLTTAQKVYYLTPVGELAVVTGGTSTIERDVLPRTGYDFSQARAVFNAAEQRGYFFVPASGNGVSTGTYSSTSTDNLASIDDDNTFPYGTAGLCLVIDEAGDNRYLYTGKLSGIGGACVFNGRVLSATRDADLVSQITALEPTCTGDYTPNLLSSNTPIKVRVEADFEDGDTPNLVKTFARLTTFAPDATSEFALSVSVEKDWDERRFVQQFTQTFRTGEGYANEPYANDPYGDGCIPVQDTSLSNAKARSLRVTFEHASATESPAITGWTIEYSDTTREGRDNQ